MANQLRLDVAQLTDVGRRREHNEDNMAYVIPKDTQVMSMKGALFIVADGMGGHAAGEVASEIAVDTVSNVYYMDDNLDVAGPLLQAIKRANVAIHQRAAENMLRSGMGTTCVAAVLRGNAAYIANVGDSRAYLVRQGQVKQISLDHSWVAEQVRAGLLTEEQARTHAQRNVITRSLGTQPDVEVDVFREFIQPGDTLVLCTDGLSGLISDEELMRIVEQSVPQESVYHLVERANENGGPDNITAIVIQVHEVGVEPPGVLNPALVGGREVSEEETIALNMLSGSAAYPASPASEAHIISGPLRLSSGPLTSPDSVTAPQPALTRARRSRLFFPTLLLIFLIIVALVGGGVFYMLHLNESATISQSLTAAKGSIIQATGQTTSNPALALKNLANAQSTLQTLQRNHQLDSGQTIQFNTLQNQLVNQTRAAIASYNAQSSIFALPCLNSAQVPVSAATTSPGTTKVLASSLASVTSDKGLLLFALGSDGALYQLAGGGQPTSQYSLVSKLTPAANTKFLALTGSGSMLSLLSVQRPANNNTNTPAVYSLTLYTFGKGQGDNLGSPVTVAIDSKSLAGGFSPQPPLLTSSKNNAYVVLSSQNLARIIDYTLNATNHLVASQSKQISFSQQISSVAAFPDRFFILLSDGEVQSFPVASAFGPQAKNTLPAQVFIQAPIQPPLSATPQGFTQSMLVPTVAPTAVASGSFPLTLPYAIQLAVGVVNGTAHLYIGVSHMGDVGNHRVIDLVEAGTPSTTAGANSVKMKLVQQIASPQWLASLKSMAVDPPGTFLHGLVQQNSSQMYLVTMSTAQQSNCSG